MPLIQSSPNFLTAPRPQDVQYIQPTELPQDSPGLMSMLGTGLGEGISKSIYKQMEQSALEKVFNNMKPGASALDQLKSLMSAPASVREPLLKYGLPDLQKAQERAHDLEKIRLTEELKRQTKLDELANKPGPYVEELEKKKAGYVVDAMQQIPAVRQGETIIKRMKELSKQFTGESAKGHFLGSLIPGAGASLSTFFSPEARAEFESIAMTSIQPGLKVLNPVGAIPQAKIEMVAEAMKPNPYDSRWTIRGKLAAIELLQKNAIQRANKLESLVKKYPRGIPTEKLFQYNAESDAIIDKIADKAGVNYMEERLAAPEGRVFVYNEEQGIGKYILPEQLDEYLSRGFSQ